MTKKEIRQVAEAVKAYQMEAHRDEIKNPRGVELPSDFGVQEKDTWADDLMYQASLEKYAPREALKKVERLTEKLYTMRARATSAGAIRYDKERVQGGQPYTLGDQVLDIIEVEEQLQKARMVYALTLGGFIQIMDWAGFDTTTKKIWVDHYVYNKSLQQIGNSIRESKWKVRWAIERRANQTDFCIALDGLIQSADCS